MVELAGELTRVMVQLSGEWLLCGIRSVPRGDAVIRDPQGLIIARSKTSKEPYHPGSMGPPTIITSRAHAAQVLATQRPANFRKIVGNHRSNTNIIYKAKDPKDEGQASSQKMQI
ncbi:hypothetical protein F2Q69_00013829 [Brassica cretica]|uniref:Uncharacterized protein n=1 Tax=Brassica cretica TaxID=69181 RepID=A0A8S9QQ55_BRACR|nr:hypothetical protein F2Q69_00013829 [Brassica cretica]